MIRARLKPSCLLAAALLLVHAGAGATILPLDIPFEAKLALLSLVAFSLVRLVRHHALLRTPTAIVEIEVHDQARAAVRAGAGRWLDATILGTTCVTPMLTAINLKIEGKRLPVHTLLVADNVDAEAFRAIRVKLRWARPAAETAARGKSEA